MINRFREYREQQDFRETTVVVPDIEPLSMGGITRPADYPARPKQPEDRLRALAQPIALDLIRHVPTEIKEHTEAPVAAPLPIFVGSEDLGWLRQTADEYAQQGEYEIARAALDQFEDVYLKQAEAATKPQHVAEDQTTIERLLPLGQRQLEPSDPVLTTAVFNELGLARWSQHMEFYPGPDEPSRPGRVLMFADPDCGTFHDDLPAALAYVGHEVTVASTDRLREARHAPDAVDYPNLTYATTGMAELEEHTGWQKFDLAVIDGYPESLENFEQTFDGRLTWETFLPAQRMAGVATVMRPGGKVFVTKAQDTRTINEALERKNALAEVITDNFTITEMPAYTYHGAERPSDYRHPYLVLTKKDKNN